MKISVVVPCYNVAQWLPRCLDSILAQTHNNIEVLVVDDGSKDNTADVIKKYAQKDSRIIAIFKENGGVTSARLAGIEKATGDWIGFVDSDDEIEVDMYEKLLSNAQKYNAQISQCGYQMVFPDGHINYYHNSNKLIELTSAEAIKELLCGDIIEPGLCNKIFKRDLVTNFLNSHVMDQSIKINEDLLMNYYLFKLADKNIFEDFCPYHYMVRYTSASRQKTNKYKIFDPIKVKKIILDDADDSYRKNTLKAYIYTCINVYNGLVQEEISDFKDEKREVRELIKENKQNFALLNKRGRLLAELIINVPHLYPYVYKAYVKHFQIKKYE